MCGIVGYIGSLHCAEFLLKGLEKLEYRGYDSAGIALHTGSTVSVFKEKGRIADLRAAVPPLAEGTLGIGHTRWATHGAPSQKNAHPHQSASKRFTLVHNGVIENFQHLQNELLADVALSSETDTELVVQLVDKFVSGGLEVLEAFRLALSELKGSYAIAMMDKFNPHLLYVAKNKSPLLIGQGYGFNVVTSDAMAMLQLTNTFIELMDKEIVLLSRDSVSIQTLDGTPVERSPFLAELDASDIEKGAYPHYMLKEIDEQPSVIRHLIAKYQDASGRLSLDPAILQAATQADRVYIIACGTSYHAGLVGKEYLEKLAQIPADVFIASEFVYNPPLLPPNPLFLFISQSGETADSRAVLVDITSKGYPSLTVTNVPGSTLSREADHTLLLHAGPEIAVASTKAYTAQIAVLFMLSVAAAEHKNLSLPFAPLTELAFAASAMDTICSQKVELEALAHSFFSTTRNAFFIGRAFDYHVCLEAALKLKEISYIQAEGFAGGELKHGTIALIEDGTPVIALATQPTVNLSIRGNVKEVAARGARTCVISSRENASPDDSFVLPNVHAWLTPLVSVVPLQLLSYYAALHRGCDVDKPRNLAKSVTVE